MKNINAEEVSAFITAQGCLEAHAREDKGFPLAKWKLSFLASLR